MAEALEAKFEAATTPAVALGVNDHRAIEQRHAAADEMAHQLRFVQDELSAYKLQVAKRLFHFLNRRLESNIMRWKRLQSGEAPAADEGAESVAVSPAELAVSISQGRRAVEEALQLTISLAPAGVAHSPSTMPLAVKARFQGTPASSLKAVSVSQSWQSLLAQPDPLLALGAGPAQRWRLRMPSLDGAQGGGVIEDAESPAAKAKADAQRLAGGALMGLLGSVRKSREPEPSMVPVGTGVELVIEAVDADGKVDEDFSSVVLLELGVTPLAGGEKPPPIQGLGFVHITAGVGTTRLLSTRSGVVELLLQDGARCEPALSTMAPPPKLKLDFVAGTPVKTKIVPASSSAVCGTSVGLVVQVVDEYENVARSVGGEICLEEADGKEVDFVPAPRLALKDGQAEVQVYCKGTGGPATELNVRVSGVSGFGEATSMRDKPAAMAALPLRFSADKPRSAELLLAPKCEPVAGGTIRLSCHIKDAWENLLADPALYAQLLVVGRVYEEGEVVERTYELQPVAGSAEVSVRTECSSMPSLFWIDVKDGSSISVRLVHPRACPFDLTPIAAEPERYALSRFSRPLPLGEYEALLAAAEAKEAAAASAAAAKDAAEVAKSELSIAADDASAELEAKRAAQGAAAAAARTAAENRDAASAAAAAKAKAAEEAQAAAEAAAAAAEAAKAAAEAAEEAATAAATAAEEAAAAEAAAAAETSAAEGGEKGAVDAREEACLKLKEAWRAHEVASRVAKEAQVEKGMAEAAAAAEPLEVGQPVKMVVTAKDRFGNAVGEAHAEQVGLVNVEIKGPARFAASGKEKMPKAALSDGRLEFDVMWYEAEKPRPVSTSGLAEVKVLLQTAKAPKAVESFVDLTFRHSKPARVVLGARPWAGEGPAPLEALVGKPLVVPVMFVDRYGCVCSAAESALVHLVMEGKGGGERVVHECSISRGVGEVSVCRMLAEEVACSILEDDRVLDAAENESLESRRRDDKEKPLQGFFVDQATVAFRHADACKLQLSIDLESTDASNVKAAPEKPPPPLSIAGPAADGADEALAGASAAAEPAELVMSAGASCAVTVTALDNFDNPATSAVWWKSRGDVKLTLEEEAVPKQDLSTLSTNTVNLVAAEPVPRRLPATNGVAKHSVKLTADGLLKNPIPLTLKQGKATAKLKATIAGELRLVVGHTNPPKEGAAVCLADGCNVARVKAAGAEMFDLVPLDQGPAGMRVMVHARDAFGNLDEECDREVVIELGQQPLGGGQEQSVIVPGGGLVKLVGGVAELAAISNGPSPRHQRSSGGARPSSPGLVPSLPLSASPR